MRAIRIIGSVVIGVLILLALGVLAATIWWATVMGKGCA